MKSVKDKSMNALVTGKAVFIRSHTVGSVENV